MAVRFSDDQVRQATQAHSGRPGARASYTEVSTDSRQVSRDCLFVALRGERFDGHDFLSKAIEAGAAGLVVELGRAVGIDAPEVAIYEVKNTLHALGGLARFHRQRFKIPVGAVTGSNGKTTTKELVASILAVRGRALKTEGNLNNEIGVPLTLFRLDPGHTAAIIEMGMNRPNEIRRLTDIARPDAGLVTVVQPAHLEGLGSIEGVAKAKGELFWGLGPTGTAVVNADDPRVVAEVRGLPSKTVTFGRGEAADVRLERATPRGRSGLALRIVYQGQAHEVALKLVGEHNAMNATGAFALALALGYSPLECQRGLEAAAPARRRLELRDAPGGIAVLDDCYNANPGSMAAALLTLKALAPSGHAVAVLGDMLELGPAEAQAHRRLGEEAAASARQVAFLGPRSAEAFQVARAHLGDGAAHFDDVDALVGWLKPALRDGDVVLVKASRGMRLERVVDALMGESSGGAH